MKGQGENGMLLQISDLRVDLRIDGELKPVIHDARLQVGRGEAVGLVGESGAGKSMTLRAVLRMLPAGAAEYGEIRLGGVDVRGLSGTALREFRANDVGVVFQDPPARLNPVRRVGDFLTEPLVRVRGVEPTAARRRMIEILEEIGIDDGERRLRQYPHELSGGLLQRMVIAAVVSMEPRLILADEPTTALDVTTQADVMRIFEQLRRDHGIALLLVTHDLDLAAAICDRVAVMYAGRVVEQRTSAELLGDPLHPYTAALSRSRPHVDEPRHRLETIAGRPLSAFEVPPGCSFAPRCEHAEEACRQREPALATVDGGDVACLRAGELRGRLVDGCSTGGSGA